MEPEARRAAAIKLSEILDDFLRAGESTRAVDVIEALGATGSEVAAAKLGQLFDQTEDSQIEDALIQALGEVGRNALSLATPGS